MGDRSRPALQQAGTNANGKHDDPAMREWARRKQRRMRGGLSSGNRRMIGCEAPGGGLQFAQHREVESHEWPPRSDPRASGCVLS
jgi:hypothetical protein